MPTISEPTPMPKGESPTRCPLCGASLSDSAELQQHLDGHAEHAAEGLPSPAGAATHRCTFCPAAFDTPEALKRHLDRAHGK